MVYTSPYVEVYTLVMRQRKTITVFPPTFLGKTIGWFVGKIFFFYLGYMLVPKWQ